MGAIHRLGDAAQSGLGRASLLRQDRTPTATAHYASLTSTSGGTRHSDSANHERPRQDWIEIPVPALVSESLFALAQEQLQRNKHHSPRRTIAPSLLQGMLVCEKCGYALYRSSAKTSKQKLYYYRCLGSDAYRYRNGAVCDNRPIRQDYLDSFIWTEILRLLDDPALIQAELDRRMEAARKADPLRKREESLQREQVRIQKNIDRLVTAYQESLVTLQQLRQRMPDLRRQEQALQSELLSLAEAATDQSKYLRLAETLADFRCRLRARADSLDVVASQKILRLLVKEILVGKETITIRHSIPTPHPGPRLDASPGPVPAPPIPTSGPSYLLRTRSHHPTLWRSFLRPAPFTASASPLTPFHHRRLQPHPDQFQHRPVHHPHAHDTPATGSAESNRNSLSGPRHTPLDTRPCKWPRISSSAWWAERPGRNP